MNIKKNDWVKLKRDIWRAKEEPDVYGNRETYLYAKESDRGIVVECFWVMPSNNCRRKNRIWRARVLMWVPNVIANKYGQYVIKTFRLTSLEKVL